MRSLRTSELKTGRDYERVLVEQNGAPYAVAILLVLKTTVPEEAVNLYVRFFSGRTGQSQGDESRFEVGDVKLSVK